MNSANTSQDTPSQSNERSPVTVVRTGSTRSQTLFATASAHTSALPKAHQLNPPHIIDLPSKRPVFRFRHQSLPHRILLHISPLLRELLSASNTVMKTRTLPFPSLVQMRPDKLAFPILHPTFQRECQIPRSTKQMEMIGHQKIISQQPCICFLPYTAQRFMHFLLRYPGNPIFCIHCQKENVRPFQRDSCPLRRCLASHNWIDWNRLLHD